MNLQSEEIVENYGNSQIDGQTYGDKEQIAHVSGNQKDEEQQDKDGQAAAQVDFVQFGMDIFGGVVAAVYLVSGRKQATDFVHSLLNAFTEAELVGAFFGRERDVNRIQAVDAVIALRFLFGMHYFDELIQANQCAVAVFYGDGGGIKSIASTARHQHDTHPCRCAVGAARLGHTQKVGRVVLRNGFTDVVDGHTEGLQPVIVVHQLPFHRCGAVYFDLVKSGNIVEPGFDIVLGILLDDDGYCGRVDRKSHEGARRIFVGATHGNVGVRDFARQVVPCLPNDGRCFEAGGIDGRMFVEFEGDAPPSVARCRIDVFDAFDTCQHRFELRGRRHLYYAGGVIGHREVDRQTGQRV